MVLLIGLEAKTRVRVAGIMTGTPLQISTLSEYGVAERAPALAAETARLPPLPQHAGFQAEPVTVSPLRGRAGPDI